MKWEITNWPVLQPTVEVSEETATQYLHITGTEDAQGTEAAVAALQNLQYTSENGGRPDPTAVNILQQIIDLGAEPHDAAAVASVVAVAPSTVTVVKQVKVALPFPMEREPRLPHPLEPVHVWFKRG
ncbi:UNVERIFIED_CONTAM: hypothetical protein K2H54_028445 [Gekko kuhli]